ncbi:hypothetical protein GCM10009564_00660 [Streptomyces thermogriseus]|uniref:HTH domain-containing protein n=1 Tax=Streptomyces thermogriseus TaxID=75292 RepID=A0ABP4DBK1_9ACTN
MRQPIWPNGPVTVIRGGGLRAVAALRKLLEQLEAVQVRSARNQGWSWQEIAHELGVSRQAVHKKYGRR